MSGFLPLNLFSEWLASGERGISSEADGYLRDTTAGSVRSHGRRVSS